MLMRMGATKIQAHEEVIQYKREMAVYHEQQGNVELAKQLLVEIGEWNEEHENRMPKPIYTGEEK